MAAGWLGRLWERLRRWGEAAYLRQAGPETAARVARLTSRQLEVARLALDGLTNRQIAARLGLSEETVKKHITLILHTLGIHSRRELERPDLRRRLRGPP